MLSATEPPRREGPAVSAPVKLAFDGTVANRTSLMMEGTVTVDSPSRGATRCVGWDRRRPAAAASAFRAEGRANVVGASIALTNV